MTRPASSRTSQAVTTAELERAATLRLYVIMSRALRSVTGPLREQLKQWDLSPTEFGVLEMLYEKGTLALGEIAERILVTAPNLTYTMKGLEQRRLVRRRPSGEDQRMVFAELTDKGRALIALVFPEHVQLMQQAMRGLSREEKHQAADLLKRLGLGVLVEG